MNHSLSFSLSIFALFSLAGLYAQDDISTIGQSPSTTDSLIIKQTSEILSENLENDENSGSIIPSSNIDNLDFFAQESSVDLDIEEFTQQFITLIIGLLENPHFADKDTLNTHVIEQLTQLFTQYSALIKISIDVEKRTALPEESTLNPKVQLAFDHLTKMFIGAANIAANKHDTPSIIANLAGMVENLAHIIVLAKRSGALSHETTRTRTHGTASLSLVL